MNEPNIPFTILIFSIPVLMIGAFLTVFFRAIIRKQIDELKAITFSVSLTLFLAYLIKELIGLDIRDLLPTANKNLLLFFGGIALMLWLIQFLRKREHGARFMFWIWANFLLVSTMQIISKVIDYRTFKNLTNPVTGARVFGGFANSIDPNIFLIELIQPCVWAALCLVALITLHSMKQATTKPVLDSVVDN